MAGGCAWQRGMGGRGAWVAEGHAWQGDRMTDACENIALPQTSFAGGN